MPEPQQSPNVQRGPRYMLLLKFVFGFLPGAAASAWAYSTMQMPPDELAGLGAALVSFIYGGILLLGGGVAWVVYYLRSGRSSAFSLGLLLGGFALFCAYPVYIVQYLYFR